MNFFKKNFNKNDVYACEQKNQVDLEEQTLKLDAIMSKKLENLKNKLNNKT